MGTPHSPELEPHHQMQFSVIRKTPFFGSRYNKCISIPVDRAFELIGCHDEEKIKLIGPFGVKKKFKSENFGNNWQIIFFYKCLYFEKQLFIISCSLESRFSMNFVDIKVCAFF